MALLEIRNLSVEFQTAFGPFRAVDGIDMTLEEGDILGVVGESGSGKSVTMLALMGLLPWTAKVEAERLAFAGQDLLGLPTAARRRIVGKDMAMIFQEPMTSLNPCFTVGFQLMESLKVHEGLDRHDRHRRAVELLDLVGIPDPETRLGAFPHQLSGGMNQRVMIAMSIACNPRLLIANEPTTALDVTIQAQVIELMKDLVAEFHMSILFITHDLGVIAQTADRVAVMYLGSLVETGTVRQVINSPAHPYTRGLLNSLPKLDDLDAPLTPVPGDIPSPLDRPTGCVFHTRCQESGDLAERCRAEVPEYSFDSANHQVACHLASKGEPA